MCMYTCYTVITDQNLESHLPIPMAQENRAYKQKPVLSIQQMVKFLHNLNKSTSVHTVC
jgi:hypothetical protein